MTAMLALSMAAAIAVSSTETPRYVAVAIEGVTFSVPESWIEQDSASVMSGLASQVWFTDASEPQADRHLVLGAFEARVRRNALVMLTAVIPRMIGAVAKGPVDLDHPLNFRMGRFEGARLVARSRLGDQVQLHRLTVMTVGGTAYWVVHLYATYPNHASSAAQVARDDALYEQVLRSVRLSGGAENRP